MKRRSSWIVALVGVLALAIVSSACGATPTPQVVTQQQTVVVKETQVVKEVATSAPTATPAPKPGAPMELTIDVGATMALNLDPLNWKSTLDKTILNQTLYDGLVRRGFSMELLPSLADSWQIGSDGVTWTFKLRKDVKFHDGTPFNAQAVKFNIDRWRDPNTQFITRFTYAGAIKEAKVTDDYTIDIVTNGRFAVLSSLLTGFGSSIVSPTAVQQLGKDFDAKAVGTGPFKVSSFKPGEELILVRNDDYWGAKPYLTKVRFIPIREDASRTAALKTGATQVLSGAPFSQFPFLRADPAIQIIENPGVFYAFIGFNCKNKPTSDAKLRRAIVQAIDMKAITQAVYGTEWQNYCGSIGPLINGYDAGIPCIKFDPAASKQALADTGYAGLELTYTYYTSPANILIAQILQGYLKDVDINLKLEMLEYGASVAKITAGNAQMFQSGWGNAEGNPISNLTGMFPTRQIGGTNWAFYSNPELDKIIEQATGEMDATKQLDLVRQAETILINDTPHLAIGSPISVIATSKTVSGWQAHPIGDYVLNTVQVVK